MGLKLIFESKLCIVEKDQSTLPDEKSAPLHQTGSSFPFWKFLPVREVAMSLFQTRTGRNFQNGKTDSHKSDLEKKYGFWNSKLGFNRC